jgi:predicted secreted hydrolase
MKPFCFLTYQRKPGVVVARRQTIRGLRLVLRSRSSASDDPTAPAAKRGFACVCTDDGAKFFRCLGLVFGFVAFGAAPGLGESAATVPLKTADGFTVPQPRPTFVFPRDHGSHPDFKIEWWYLTGHLFTVEKVPRRFGFQATFFRSASPVSVAKHPAPLAFGHDQIYLAHMALLEVGTGRFLHQERLNRAGWDAFASTDTLDVRHGDWSLALTDPKAGAGAEILQLVGGIRADARFTLELTPQKPLVRFGDGGYSRKGAAPTAASYYLTFTRLGAKGVLRLDGQDHAVEGSAWMDHEYSSSQLDTNQVGWDWLSVQFHDGRELMLYLLRTRDGGFDPASTLTWVDEEGKTSTAPFTWEPLTRWQSPRTGASYPHKIRLSTVDPATGQAFVVIVEPMAKDQELDGKLGGVAYYEGACLVLAEDGRELGQAYLELTGYDTPLEILR